MRYSPHTKIYIIYITINIYIYINTNYITIMVYFIIYATAILKIIKYQVIYKNKT